MSTTKNQKVLVEKFDKYQTYEIDEAIRLLHELKYTKFDESVDIAVKLNVDPRHADQNIRVTTGLPNGSGKEVSVLVITQGPKEKEALEAGADFVGNKEYLEKIKGGWTEVDKIVATPDMMGQLGKLGRILGPRGLMPNPKSGTVTMDVANAVKELKAGKIELRVDKNGVVHAGCGKLSFDADKLVENIKTVYSTLLKAKPGSVKGIYLKKFTVSSTMGPGINIDLASLR
ncbi:MAG: 50S ribosomal protein L1 [Candidatus Marinimicrobia bacterium]|nr:50S ribosomal protein L1 [Candidatus Neomarinimicrobiota bacterium]